MTILALVTDYLAAVEACLVMFERKFNRRDLVRAWRDGAIAQSGFLSEDIHYRMHGLGCAVEFPDHEVDFDFATQREVGFDVWRLWIYAEQYPDRYPQYQERSAVEADLTDQLLAGTIHRAEVEFLGEANDQLFTLSKSLIVR